MFILWKDLKSSKSVWVYIFLFCSLLPILLVNIHNYHDWGGDFAQYLSQTKSLFTSNNSIGVINATKLAPKQRSEGFSLLLALPYFVFGHNIKGFLLLTSACLFALGFILFRFYRKETNISSLGVTILMVFTFVFNYKVQELKLEIMPKFPFMLAVYGGLLLFDRIRKSNLVLLGILLGVAISLKNLGWVLYFSVLFFLLFHFFKSLKKESIPFYLFVLIVPILSEFLIKLVIFQKASANNLLWYRGLFFESFSFDQLLNSISIYIDAITKFFEQEVWGWGNVILKTGAISFIVIGMMAKWKKAFHVSDLFFIFYFVTLLVYPYQKEPFRFLIPVFPIILLYLFWGLNQIELKELSNSFIAFVFLGILLSNTIKVKNLLFTPYEKQIGPEHHLTQEAFSEVQKIVKNNEIIGCKKPWVLNYYTGKTTYYLKSDSLNKPKEPKYILLAKNKVAGVVYDEKLSMFIYSQNKISPIWQNQYFAIYNIE